MAKSTVNWLGPAVTEKLQAAQVAGVNRTMAACVVEAKNSHPWKNQTGVLEGGIGIVDYAAPDGEAVKGTWGVHDARYAAAMELGGYAAAMELGADIEHPGGTPYYIDAGGMAVFVSLDSPIAKYLPRTKPHAIHIPARPYLRPAADKHYPSLAGNIRKAYEAKSASAPSGGADG